MKITTTLLLLLALFSGDALAQDAEVPAALNFKMKTIDGEDKSLADYQGKVVVVVNVASRCGMTPQYGKLQELHEQYSEKGLAILGFPCNQFGGQEPGTEEEIKTFCVENYDVAFDMFSKIEVKGDGSCDLYRHLSGLDVGPKGAGDVSWNFEKFVLDRKGNVVARFGSRTDPMGKEFVATLTKALDSE